MLSTLFKESMEIILFTHEHTLRTCCIRIGIKVLGSNYTSNTIYTFIVGCGLGFEARWVLVSSRSKRTNSSGNTPKDGHRSTVPIAQAQGEILSMLSAWRNIFDFSWVCLSICELCYLAINMWICLSVNVSYTWINQASKSWRKASSPHFLVFLKACSHLAFMSAFF